MDNSSADKQLELMNQLVELSKDRSQMSAERSYMNAERTLSVWIRTALGAMIFGLAIDRFGLMLRELPATGGQELHQTGMLTHIAGFVLMIYSMIIAFSSAIRYRSYCREYRKQFKVPLYHGTNLPSFYAFMIVCFGAGLLVLMIWVP